MVINIFTKLFHKKRLFAVFLIIYIHFYLYIYRYLYIIINKGKNEVS